MGNFKMRISVVCYLVAVSAKRNKNAWKDNDSFASKVFGSKILNIDRNEGESENPREVSLLESLSVAAEQAGKLSDCGSPKECKKAKKAKKKALRKLKKRKTKNLKLRENMKISVTKESST